MAGCESILKVILSGDRGAKAKLTLVAECAFTTESDLPAYAPSYIDRGESENIPCVTDKSLIDSSSPIMIYMGEDSSLSPILLLEETRYEIKLEGAVDSAFDYITENSNDIALNKLYFKASGDDALYVLIFRSYVGKGFFDVTIDGERISIPFEVRSKKIDYLRDYPLMLKDISEFSTSLLLEVSSPLHREYALGDTQDNGLYENFMLLDYIFMNMDLIGAYNQACTNKHCEMMSFSENVPAGMVCNMDPSDIPDLISSDNLFLMDGGPIAGRLAPLYATERNYQDNYDTPENRVIKDLLLTVQRMIQRLILGLRSEVSAYVENRLLEMRSEINRMADDPWLNDVGELNRIPFESTVLQRRTGYSDLFRIYQIIGMGAQFKQDDLEGLLKGQNSRVYQVYEYWCYIRIYRCLCSMSEDKPKFPLTEEDGRWTISIKKGAGVRFKIPIGDSVAEVRLLYNKRFSQQKDDFRSYSMDLYPDFTLIIQMDSDAERTLMINLDAKYKAKPKDTCDMQDDWVSTDCWESDICKMHTYRDALLYSCGSYVLYPGSVGIMYTKPLNGEDWPRRHSLVIPSVGAIPLNPGSDHDKELEEVLRSIFSVMAGCFPDEKSLEPNFT